MKLLTNQQLHELDVYTIEHEPIRSIDLMERAAKVMTQAITSLWSNSTQIVVFAGPGNNGGDALAIARLLAGKRYDVSVFLFNIKKALSEECAINRDKLKSMKDVRFQEVIEEFNPPLLEKGMLVIDGLFGAGISRPLSGGFASLVKLINQSPAEVVSIDMPSGLMAEDNSFNVKANIINADVTLSIHQPKLSFFFPEYQRNLGMVKVVDIQLSSEGHRKMKAQYTTTEEYDIRCMMQERDDFAHKGSMGHALIVAGSYGMAGAAVLAAKACLRSGVGKLTVKTPARNNDILQISVPEAIIKHDANDRIFTEAVDTADYNSLGIGPGLGTEEPTAIGIISQIRRSQVPCVIDADALNILATHKAWLVQLPKGMILTPHPKEFDRLNDSGEAKESYARLNNAREMAAKLQAYILLKGHHSMLCTPSGEVIINTTGNSGMATAGSGDVLTGIITALLSRGYDQQKAATIGMYVHGLAGDLAAAELGKESLIASDLIAYLPKAFAKICQEK